MEQRILMTQPIALNVDVWKSLILSFDNNEIIIIRLY